MKDYSELIKRLDVASPLQELHRLGVEPEQLKASIRETFAPFIRDISSFTGDELYQMMGDWVHFVRLARDPWALDRFKECLSIYNEAKAVDKTATLELVANGQTEHAASLSRFWSVFRRDHKFDQLSTPDFVEENLRIIGVVLEGIAKSSLKELYVVNSIKRSKAVSHQVAATLDLGVVVDNLIQTAGLAEFLTTPVENLKISQWRNIAYHHNAIIKQGSINCWYGKPNRSEFSLDRQQLAETRARIVRVAEILNSTRTIFFFDNYEDLLSIFARLKPAIEIRPEAKFVSLYATVEALGFKVLTFNEKDAAAELVLRELTDLPKKQRAIHSSQLLYQLWCHTDATLLKIEYRGKDDRPVLRATTTGEVCQKVDKDGDLRHLASNVKFEILDQTL